MRIIFLTLFFITTLISKGLYIEGKYLSTMYGGEGTLYFNKFEINGKEQQFDSNGDYRLLLEKNQNKPMLINYEDFGGGNFFINNIYFTDGSNILNEKNNHVVHKWLSEITKFSNHNLNESTNTIDVALNSETTSPKIGAEINGRIFLYREPIEIYWNDWFAYPMVDKKELPSSEQVKFTIKGEGKTINFNGVLSIDCEKKNYSWLSTTGLSKINRVPNEVYVNAISIFCKNNLEKISNTSPKIIESNTNSQNKNFSLSNSENRSLKWSDVGIDSYAEKVWIKYGIKSPSVAKRWINIGLKNPFFIKEWAKIGVSTPEEVKRWNDIGISSPSYASSWKKYCETPEEAKIWKDAGYDITVVISWKKNGVNTLEEVKKWESLGLNYNNVIQWKNIGINTVEEVKKWKDAGFDYFVVDSWKKNGVNTLEKVKKWKEYGFNNTEAGSWIAIGLNTPEDVNVWINNGVVHPSKVKKYIKMGILPEDVAWYEAKRMIIKLLIYLCIPILGIFLYFFTTLFKSSNDIWENNRFFWLTEQEKEDFRSEYDDAKNRYDEEYNLYLKREKAFWKIQTIISNLHKKAENNNISKNQDGSYSRRSNLGKKIQDELDILTKKSLPKKPIFFFESSLSISRWKNFDNLWQTFNKNYKITKALLWTLYICIVSIILTGIMTTNPDPNIYLMGIVNIIVSVVSFNVFNRITKGKEHNISCPPSVTIENIDTLVTTYIPTDICKDIKCFWSDLNRFGG